jgi:hypothetical protein
VQRAARKLVLDQRFLRVLADACTRSQAQVACEQTDAAVGPLKSRAHPVNAAAAWRAVLARGEEVWVHSEVAGESGAANQQMSDDPGPSLRTRKLGGS